MAGLLNLLFPQDRSEEIALRREAFEEQRRLRERQDALQAYQTLGQILGLEKSKRGPLIKMAGEMFGAKYGMDNETLTKWLSQVDDDTASALAESVRAFGVETKGDPKALLQVLSPDKAFEAILQASRAAQAAAKEEERNKVAGKPLPEGPGIQLFGRDEPGMSPIAPPEMERRAMGRDEVLETLDRREEELARRGQQIAALSGGGLPEGANRWLDSEQARIKETRERLAGGRSANLHFDTVDGQRVGVDPKTGERVVTLGNVPKEGQTLVERLAEAEADAKANPDDQSKQRKAANLKAAFDKQVELAREQGRAAAQGRESVPSSPTAGQVEKMAEFDGKITSIADLIKGAADKDVQKVLGMSPGAITKRVAGDYIEGALTEKQSIYLAQLAESTAELRRFLVGAAQTVPEMRALLPLLPKDSDPASRQVAKLKAIQQGLERNRGAFERALRGANVRVPGGASAPPKPSEVDAARGRLGLD